MVLRSYQIGVWCEARSFIISFTKLCLEVGPLMQARGTRRTVKSKATKTKSKWSLDRRPRYTRTILYTNQCTNPIWNRNHSRRHQRIIFILYLFCVCFALVTFYLCSLWIFFLFCFCLCFSHFFFFLFLFVSFGISASIGKSSSYIYYHIFFAVHHSKGVYFLNANEVK